jgi:hypothetical protein
LKRQQACFGWSLSNLVVTRKAGQRLTATNRAGRHNEDISSDLKATYCAARTTVLLRTRSPNSPPVAERQLAPWP